VGNFYTNYTLRGPSQQAVSAALAGRSAIVTPVKDNSVVVFDEESDLQSAEVIAKLGSHLSIALGCPVLAVLNHDDDILFYQLYEGGSQTDEYCSAPGYFSGADAPPTGGNALKLCAAFGSSATEAVEPILHPPDGERATFAFEQHDALVRALGLSDYGVAAGFNYVSQGELPGDLTEADLIRIQ
jgi:hypothetical protein